MISPPDPILTDAFGRTIDYLRVSLTDACNLRCVYCMPKDMTFMPSREKLSFDEYRRLLPLFAEVGFRKFRFTGGEPTLHPHLVDLVSYTASLPGDAFCALTTNALKLKELAAPLAAAGLRRVNVSLDSLDATRYHRMARGPSLPKAWEGLLAAEDAGLEVKINAVMVRNFNEEDLIPLAELSRRHAWQIRFLEMMPFAEQTHFQHTRALENRSIQGQLEAHYGSLEPVGNGLDGEARVMRIPGAPGELGFISPLSDPFCADCNRMRLTADGKLRLCLLKEDELDLRSILRNGGTDDELLESIRDGIRKKPWGHELSNNRFALNRSMNQIGG